MTGKKKRGPSSESLREEYDHSYDHRGETGMFGGYFTVDVKEWTPYDGDNEFAIVPFQVKENSEFRKKNPDMNNPSSDDQLKAGDAWKYFLAVLVHSNIGPNKDRVVCPRTMKDKCPICELRDELRNELAKLKARDRTDRGLEERVSQLGTSKRALYNIMSFNSQKERDKGVQVWAAPHASIQDVIIAEAKSKRGDGYKSFAVLSEKWNILFEKIGKGLNTEYSGVSIENRRKEDDLTEAEEQELLDSAYVLDDIVEVLSYEQLYEMLHGVKSGEGGGSREQRRERSERNEVEPEREEPRGRERSGRRGREEEPTTEEEPRGGRTSRADSNVREGRGMKEEDSGVGDEYPECFAIEFNQRGECEECASDVFKACMKATDEAQKSRATKSSSENRGGGRGVRSEKRSR